MLEQVGAEKVWKLGRSIQGKIPGFGFVLLGVEFNKPGISNYILNIEHSGMVATLEEAVVCLLQGQGFSTPGEG